MKGQRSCFTQQPHHVPAPTEPRLFGPRPRLLSGARKLSSKCGVGAANRQIRRGSRPPSPSPKSCCGTHQALMIFRRLIPDEQAASDWQLSDTGCVPRLRITGHSVEAAEPPFDEFYRRRSRLKKPFAAFASHDLLSIPSLWSRSRLPCRPCLMPATAARPTRDPELTMLATTWHHQAFPVVRSAAGAPPQSGNIANALSAWQHPGPGSNGLQLHPLDTQLEPHHHPIATPGIIAPRRSLGGGLVGWREIRVTSIKGPRSHLHC
ncbi:hypothetical protein B0T14DRAFT_231250 [Immersiella caudata]|uniref:Uncharacterized protein n=1 Tax=Immersiella caudata TaxID=314043 RepID=A0AA39WRS0_9PEZI|nr:hypothetical protein B0T14DRAFT_231250 [Immersiella caudata]